MKPIVDHKALIDEMGGNTAVAGHLSTPDDPCPPVRVQQWKLSNSIPPQYWLRLVEVAAEMGLVGITTEWLTRKVPPRKKAAKAA